MSEDLGEWLIKKHYEEICTNLRATWDLYMKFYVAFLSVNVIGLGLVMEHVTEGWHRAPLIIAFSVQNMVSLATAIHVNKYSQGAVKELGQIAEKIKESSHQEGTPLATIVFESKSLVDMMKWATGANSLTHPLLIACWILVAFIPLIKKA